MNLADLIQTLAEACPVFVAIAKLPADAVRQALDAGLASTWEDSPIGPAIVLSSLACEQRKLTLDDERGIESSRWVPEGEWRPTPCYDPSIPDEHDEAAPGLCPLDALIVAESALRLWDPDKPARSRAIHEPGERCPTIMEICSAPRPLIVMGTGRVNWSPAIEAPATPCPVCKGRPLSDNVVCMGCLRSGIDDRLPPVSEDEKPKPPGQQRQATDEAPRKRRSKNGKPLGRPPGKHRKKAAAKRRKALA